MNCQRRARPRHVEDDHQAAVIRWAAYSHIVKGEPLRVFDVLLHIPNGGKRDPREAARLKRQGVKAGVSDLFLAWPCHGKAGLWIEMKAPDGSATPDQLEWIDRMLAAGYAAVVCYGVDEAIRAITNYLDKGTP